MSKRSRDKVMREMQQWYRAMIKRGRYHADTLRQVRLQIRAERKAKR